MLVHEHVDRVWQELELEPKLPFQSRGVLDVPFPLQAVLLFQHRGDVLSKDRAENLRQGRVRREGPHVFLTAALLILEHLGHDDAGVEKGMGAFLHEPFQPLNFGAKLPVEEKFRALRTLLVRVLRRDGADNRVFPEDALDQAGLERLHAEHRQGDVKIGTAFPRLRFLGENPMILVLPFRQPLLP